MKKYRDNYPDEFTEIIPGLGEFIMFTPQAKILKDRRESLGLTQQQVATAAGITLRQYQRFETAERLLSSSSMRIGMSVCDALALDPHRFAHMPLSKISPDQPASE